MKAAIVIGIPLLTFVLSMAMGWNAVAPNESGEGPPSDSPRLSPRQQAQQQSRAKRSQKSMSDQMEARISRYNPAPPTKHYDGEGMEKMRNHADSWSGKSIPFVACDYAYGWAATAPEEMFEWLMAKDGEEVFEANALFSEWVKSSPKRALSASYKMSDPTLRAQALMSCMVHLSKTDPVAMRELLLENLSLYKRDVADRLYYDYDLGGEAIELIASLPPSGKRTDLLVSSLMEIKDQKSVAKFWNDLPLSEKRDLVDSGLGVVYANPFETENFKLDDMADLLRERVEHTGDSDMAEDLIRAFGGEWAASDLSGAVEWVDQHMIGRARVDAMSSLWFSKAERDPVQAARLWQGLPDGGLKKRMSRAIISGTPEDQKSEIQAILGME